MLSNTNFYVIAGLGASGFSALRFLKSHGCRVAITDTRKAPPFLKEINAQYPDVDVRLGALDMAVLNQADCIISSPGISLKDKAISAQLKRGIPVIGDIELFANYTTQPVIAITGTNAKSTVTTLVGLMAKSAGYDVAVGGNLGVPVLDLLMDQPAAKLFVLELSSFQLETTFNLKSKVATILNLSPDHMDRYNTYNEYHAAKLRIYHGCDIPVCNRDDALTECPWINEERKLYFTSGRPKKNEFGLLEDKGEIFLAYDNEKLIAAKALPVKGKHYQINALSALAVGYAYGLEMDAMLHTLRTFLGLPHRCQFVRERRGVRWFNDSKGTNVGASSAAIEGIGQASLGKLVVILGGQGKNADFAPLSSVTLKYARHLILLGEAADELAKLFHNKQDYTIVANMEEAVLAADKIAQAQDDVLLSPACASFDMFKNFEHRGDVFMSLVNALP